MPEALDRLKAALADRYRIERELGAGGMATVYLARDLKHNREVAVKVLRPDLAASLGPERFLREVTIAANLQHPHILPVYDSGEAEGFLYYVMPYVEGESLRDRLTKHGELPLTDAVRILRDVADAMAAAHARGVVHRDIKPENIMLSGRHALVADFGVAKAVSEATGLQTLTTAGVALGTPTYMAPEQASADPHTDHRADIYAFGVTAYEMLTGQPPFVGATPQAVLAAHVTEAPVAVTQRRATIPPALAQLIMRCLEKKPADRPQSAEELLPVLEGLTTPSGGMTPTQTMPVHIDRPRRRATVIRAGAAITVLAVIVVGWWLLRDRGAAMAMDGTGTIPIAVLSFETRATGDSAEAFSEGLAEDIATQLSKIAGLEVKAPAAARRMSVDTMSYGEIATRLGATYLVHGRWDRAGDDLRVTARLILPATEAQLWADDYQRDWAAAGIFDLRSDVARQVAAALDLRLTPEEQAQLAALPTSNTEAYKAYQLGRFFVAKRVDENLPRAIQYFREAIAADSGFALAYAAIADALWLSLIYSGADSAATVPLVEAAALRALAIDSTLGEAYASLAAIEGNDLSAKEAAYRRAIALSPDYATAHQRYGGHLVWRGRIEEGLAEIRRAHELDPVSEVIHGNLIEALLAVGQIDEAIAEYDRMRALAPTIPWVVELLGWAYVAAGRLDDALRFFEERRLTFGEIVTHSRMGDREKAVEIYRQRGQSFSTFFQGAVEMALGDTSRGFDLWRQAAREGNTVILVDWAMRYEPYVGVWHDSRLRSVMNIMDLDVIDGMVVPLDGPPGN